MATLYIVSTTPYAGKSALCVGLGKHFQQEGYRIGYSRPVMTTKTCIGDCVIDEDASWMIKTLGLTDPIQAIWPVCLDAPTVEAVLRGQGGIWGHRGPAAHAHPGDRRRHHRSGQRAASGLVDAGDSAAAGSICGSRRTSTSPSPTGSTARSATSLTETPFPTSSPSTAPWAHAKRAEDSEKPFRSI